MKRVMEHNLLSSRLRAFDDETMNPDFGDIDTICIEHVQKPDYLRRRA